MESRYKQGEKAFYHFFDWNTYEFICVELEIERYDYLDGMQWNVIDEYRCNHKRQKTFLKFFKKTVNELYVVNAKSIHINKIISAILTLREIIYKYEYLTQKPYIDYSNNMCVIVLASMRRLKKYETEFPELFLIAVGIGINDGNITPTRVRSKYGYV